MKSAPLLNILAFLIAIHSSVLGESKFRERELQMDLYGLGNFHKEAQGGYANGIVKSFGGPDIGNQRQLSGRPAWGLGGAANFFFNQYIGVGLDQSAFGRNQGSRQPQSGDFYYLRWQTSGYITFRYPIAKLNLAPYVLIGGGAQYGNIPNFPIKVRNTTRNYSLSGQGFGQLGGGLDYRFSRHLGIFSDLRWLFSGVSGLPTDQMQWRYGVRIIF